MSGTAANTEAPPASVGLAPDARDVHARLAELIRFFAGDDVAKFQVIYETVSGNDGQFSVTVRPDDHGLPELGEMQRVVSEVLARVKAGEVMSYPKIAEKAGYANSDKFRTCVRQTAAIRGDFRMTNRGLERLE